MFFEQQISISEYLVENIFFYKMYFTVKYYNSYMYVCMYTILNIIYYYYLIKLET